MKTSTTTPPPTATNLTTCLAILEQRVFELISVPEPDWKKLETAFGILLEARQHLVKERDGSIPTTAISPSDSRAEQERKVKEIFALDHP